MFVTLFEAIQDFCQLGLRYVWLVRVLWSRSRGFWNAKMQGTCTMRGTQQATQSIAYRLPLYLMVRIFLNSFTKELYLPWEIYLKFGPSKIFLDEWNAKLCPNLLRNRCAPSMHNQLVFSCVYQHNILKGTPRGLWLKGVGVHLIRYLKKRMSRVQIFLYNVLI